MCERRDVHPGHNRLWHRGLGVMIAATGLVGISTHSVALTPLRSPEQQAEFDRQLANASQSIAPKVMRCLAPPTASRRVPITVRFMLSVAGRQVSQFVVLQRHAGSRAMERAAIHAIRTCAPYLVPEDLRDLGGFWVTIQFR